MTDRPVGLLEPEVRAYKPPRPYSAEYKKRILEEYERLDRAGKGALLRREGLYNQLISVWRKIARLRAEKDKLEVDLAKARTVIEVHGSSPRCWISSPPAAPRPTGASLDDHHDRHRARDRHRAGNRRRWWGCVRHGAAGGV